MNYDASTASKWLPIYKAWPRWLNQNNDYGQGVFFPTKQPVSLLGQAVFSGTPGEYPSTWPVTIPATTGLSTLEGIGISFSLISQSVRNKIDYVKQAATGSWGRDELEFIWTCSVTPRPLKVEIKKDNGEWVELPYKQPSGLASNKTPAWSWLDGQLYIVQLGLIEFTTATASSLNIKHPEQWAGYGSLGFKHPFYGGFCELPVQYAVDTGSTPLKNLNQKLFGKAANTQLILPTIKIRVNESIELVAFIHNSWSQLQEIGLILNLPRRQKEPLIQYEARIRPLLETKIISSSRDFKFAISTRLGLCSSTSFNGSSLEIYNIRPNSLPYYFSTERIFKSEYGYPQLENTFISYRAPNGEVSFTQNSEYTYLDAKLMLKVTSNVNRTWTGPSYLKPEKVWQYAGVDVHKNQSLKESHWLSIELGGACNFV